MDGGFATGINIFDKDEQIKLQERAKRFALPPEEINTFTDEHLQELHVSLGITKENDKNVRFEAIHVRGTEDMSTEDVLDYFAKYGPFGIEWIDDSCCNVVWVDAVSTARALHYISKPINNLPVRGPCDPFLRDFENETEKEDGGKSVLLRNPNREVELTDDNNEIIANKENKFEGGVDVAEISCPIPPGFWRLGKPHTKAKNILLRFAYRTDKKPYKAEKFSEYYRKYGNPNYGGLKGIITEGKKQQFKGIFDRNRAIQGSGNNEDGSKNPWGGLAENWDHDADLREKEYDNSLVIPDNKPELKNSGLLDRLGFKRAHDPEKDEEPEKARKKVKIPRMKMYADEEEQKIKRKKQLMAVKSTKETQKDLRSILGITGVRKRLDPEDLGAKLKNRIRNTPQVPVMREEKITRSIVNDRIGQREKPRKSYERRLHSDREEKTRRRRRSYHEEEKSEDEEDAYVKHKPRSKVAVVIKTQKTPTVASTVWSRIREKGRFKTAPESIGKKQSSSESSEASSSSNSSESSSESEDSDNVVERPEIKSKVLNRPGFTNNVKSSVVSKISDHKSPLRIEISNEHFRRK